MLVAVLVNVGMGVIVAIEVGIDVCVGGDVGLLVGVMVGVAVFVAVGDWVSVAVFVDVADGVNVAVTVGVFVRVGDGVGVGVRVGSVACVAASVWRSDTHCKAAGRNETAESHTQMPKASTPAATSVAVAEKGPAEADLVRPVDDLAFRHGRQFGLAQTCVGGALDFFDVHQQSSHQPPAPSQVPHSRPR